MVKTKRNPDWNGFLRNTNMPDNSTSYGREFRGRSISRQLTDTERMLDDQIDSHLQTKMQPIAGEREFGYAWLQQDLQQRAAMTEQLGKERMLAAASGEYQNMDRRFNQETEDEADSIVAMREIAGFSKANPDASWADAVSAATANRPDRWGNKFFVDSINEGAKFHETDLERQKRKGDLATSIVTNEINQLTGSAKLEALRSPAGKEYLRKYNDFIMQKEMAQIPLLPHEIELKQEQMKNDLQEQKMRAQALNFADQTFEGKGKAAFFMEKSGIPVTDIGKIGGYLQGRPGVINAIAHPSFLRADPVSAAKLQEAMAVIQNPESQPADISKAETQLAYVAGAHASYVAETENALKMEDRALKYGAERGKSLGDARKEITDILAAPKNKDKPPTIAAEDQALSIAESWIKEQVTADPRLAETASAYLEKINKSRGEKDAKRKGLNAGHILSDFGMEASKLSPVASTKEVTKPGAKGSSTPARPAKAEPKVGEERNGFIYQGGDPSKRESWTKKS